MAKASGGNAVKKGPRSTRRTRGGFETEAVELRPLTETKSFRERWLPILLIAGIVFVIYLPSLDNEFVSWDDDHYIYKNHQVHYNDGIESIWFDVLKHKDKKFQGDGRTEDRVSHQYYPMVFTLFWLEFRVHQWFGDADPFLTIEENIEKGQMTAVTYHVVSVLMHMAVVMILILCFRQMGIPNWVAWVAAALFALHPMHCSSVAWAAEGKNIVSLIFYLLSLMSYIKMRRDQKWWRYVLALVLFQAALFSKTVSLTLPVVLFLTDRLLEKRWDGKLIAQSVVRMVPFLILAGIAAWTTIQVENRARTIPISPQQRPLLPAATLLWYPFKMLLPFDQSPVYSLWPVDPTKLVWFLPTLAVIAIAVLVIVYRKRINPYFMWAMLLYCVTQGPMLGIKNINYFQFAYVADHYFYHGAVGLALMLALALYWVKQNVKFSFGKVHIATVMACALALGWGVRTFTYCEVWQTPWTFWDRVLDKSPDCWPGWYNTANARKREALAMDRRINRAEQTVEERQKLEQQVETLRERLLDPKLGDAKRRQFTLLVDKYTEELNWPDYTEAQKQEFQAKYDAAMDDAVRRYKRVKEIHKQITQPYDQWISVERLRKNWTGALEAAEEAATRFPSYISKGARGWMCYYEQAGEFARYLENWERSADLYQRAAAVFMHQKKTRDAIEPYAYAGYAAKQIPNIELANKHYMRAAEIAGGLAEAYAAKKNHKQAAAYYEASSRYYAEAYRLDESRKDLQRLAIDQQKKHLTQKELE